jgi:prepilin-type N-terminal cleavage/methylation domain-containing protein/prepilin-type processing-associated H-X9-DG protein
MSKKAFTLIELLVVIAIIAILAAILFPVFAQAKAAAKKSACLSNSKQMGLAVMMYGTDYDDYYPQAYYYPNDNGSGPINGVGGYVQWSGLMQPYIKNFDIFRCPGSKANGLAPTNFIGNNAGYGVPGGQVTQYNLQDVQAPRLSYIANSMLMPRKRRSVDPMNVISQTTVDAVADTILIAEMTDYPSCINDSSQASGVSYKTHRPANAIKLLDNTPFAGEAPAEVGLAAYSAISVTDAKNALSVCRTSGALGHFHIAYTQPDRHNGGANYTYADGHAKFQSLEATLNPDKFQWGKRAYTAGGGAIYKPGTTTPVE